MGVKNFLIDGVSGTGKTTVAEELQKRGYHVLHGDRELKFLGDPQTGKPLKEPKHKSEKDKAEWRQKHLLWPLDKIKSITKDKTEPLTFFCGGSRNSSKFISLLDGVFILEVQDINEIYRRLDERVARDPTDFGGKPEEKEMVERLHATQESIPQIGIRIDSTQTLDDVVNEILDNAR